LKLILHHEHHIIYVISIAWDRVQYDSLRKIRTKISERERGKYIHVVRETCDNRTDCDRLSCYKHHSVIDFNVIVLLKGLQAKTS